MPTFCADCNRPIDPNALHTCREQIRANKAAARERARAMPDVVAERTADAYSWDTYGEQNWRACCRLLARRGYNAREIEAIMRSKWTRWAGDHANKSARVNSADLARFIDQCYADPTKRAREIADLVAGTFPFGDDGEDIEITHEPTRFVINEDDDTAPRRK